MKIPWLAYIVIGLFVTIVSFLRPAMRFFVIIGIIFTAVGIIKFIMRQTTSEKAEELRKPSSIEERHQRILQRQISEGKKNGIQHVKCVYCGAWNYPSATKCHHCKRSIR